MHQAGFTLQAFAPPGCTLALERISQSLPFSRTVSITSTMVSYADQGR
jgi:hypothetical protein